MKVALLFLAMLLPRDFSMDSADYKTAAEVIRNTETPAQFANTVSGGRWKMARHLSALNQSIMDTLRGVDGIRRLIVTMPPRFGKSELCSKYLPAWYVSTFPWKRVILSSYEATFAAKWGMKARALVNQWGPPIFGIDVSGASSARDHWDISGNDGGMETAGVGGALTGKGANLLIVDDPIKNAQDASSETIRERNWEWWLSTASTRIEPEGAAIVIQTRWHMDDLTGRLLSEAEKEGGRQWRIVNMPAIGSDGTSLWPERWPLAELLKIKAEKGSYWWSSLYMQRPTPDEGGKFKRIWFDVIVYLPEGATRAVRYWDIGSTEGDGDYSVGLLLIEHGGIYFIADVQRGQWGDLNRNRMIRQTAEIDRARFPRVETWIEAGGAGYADVAAGIIRDNAGLNIRADPITGKDGGKELRASDAAAAAEAGLIKVIAGKWNSPVLDTLCTFPNGEHDDDVDALSGAFKKIVTRRKLAVG